ncbi:MAG: hypothetical protein SO160_00225 [Lachnospiraceae bacterium]|nr:hypothetical protein [Lachnospiraceae bacterium]
MELFRKIAVCFQLYSGMGAQFLLFLCAMCFLAIHEKNKKIYQILNQYTGFIIALMVFPVTAVIIMEYCIGEEVYWRMFWLMPIPFIIAFAGTELYDLRKDKIKRTGIIAFLILFILLSGKCVYDEEGTIITPDNVEKLPKQAVEVCNMITGDAQMNGITTKKVVVPSELLSYVRQYDATIQMPYGRNALKNEELTENCDELYEMMKAKDDSEMDFMALSECLKQENCNYLVLEKKVASKKMDQYGYYQVAQTEHYILFRCDNVANSAAFI